MLRMAAAVAALTLVLGLAGPSAVYAEIITVPAADPPDSAGSLPPPTVLRGSPPAAARPVPICPPGYTLSPDYGCVPRPTATIPTIRRVTITGRITASSIPSAGSPVSITAPVTPVASPGSMTAAASTVGRAFTAQLRSAHSAWEPHEWVDSAAG